MGKHCCREPDRALDYPRIGLQTLERVPFFAIWPPLLRRSNDAGVRYRMAPKRCDGKTWRGIPFTWRESKAAHNVYAASMHSQLGYIRLTPHAQTDVFREFSLA
jgi:hypothetical protein